MDTRFDIFHAEAPGTFGRALQTAAKSLIWNPFALLSRIVWITLLIAARARPSRPAKSRAWLETGKKGHGKIAFKINDLEPLLDL
jgi:hypothetical protein